MNILIVGAGYVGLPLAIAFSKILKVDCYDIDKDRIHQLSNGIDKNKQEGGNLINKNLSFINQLDIKNNYKFIIITVPTPINEHNHPNLSHIENATINVAQFIRIIVTIYVLGIITVYLGYEIYGFIVLSLLYS